ncbi:fibrobacter succinogenes major paralogous domain-containing protein [Flavobacteriales bacterium]|nr:fibrobacter succinogenes major paralogous domain-containing protein [Flavobacteriales bacterium]
MRRIAFLLLLFPFVLFAQQDCDVFSIQGLAAENLALHDSIALFSVDSTILQSDGSYEVYLSNGTTYTQVQGCTDPAYVEYDATANTDDGSCSTLVVEGCMDPAYTEYNASANTDDGSCATLASTCDAPSMDGYDYAVVEIGDQCWFAENLRTTVYADDSSIPQVTGSVVWSDLNTGARCDYQNDAANVSTYGRLYNWYAVNNGSGLCPSGWHVPTDDEWTALETYLGANGHSGAEGTALKSSDWNGTDDFGFSALPGGYLVFHSGDFYGEGIYGQWWSSSSGGFLAWYRTLYYFNTDFGRNAQNRRYGFSVRCLRDAD